MYTVISVWCNDVCMIIITCSELTEVVLVTVCWSTVQGAVMWHNLCNILCELSELVLYLAKYWKSWNHKIIANAIHTHS